MCKKSSTVQKHYVFVCVCIIIIDSDLINKKLFFYVQYCCNLSSAVHDQEVLAKTFEML